MPRSLVKNREERTPDFSILFLCARVRMDTETAERLRNQVQKKIDWEALIQTAHRQGLLPLLFHNLNTVCSDCVPPPVMVRLREASKNNQKKNLYMTKELIDLLDALEENEIPALPYKGPILALSVYGNLSLRPFTDLDILIHKRNVLKAKETLGTLGYKPTPPFLPREEKYVLGSRKEFVLRKRISGTPVDLHWGFGPNYFPLSIDFSGLWARRKMVLFSGRKIPHFSPEDLLLILCFHGTKHCWERLEWLCVISELVRHEQALDWDHLLHSARSTGTERMLFLSLRLAHEYFDTHLPNNILQRMKSNKRVDALADHIGQRVIRGGKDMDRYGIFDRACFHIQSRERTIEKFHYAFVLLFNPNERDISLIPLPAYLSFLTFLLRPLRLFIIYGTAALRWGFSSGLK